MKKIHFFLAAVLSLLLCALCACKAPVPEILLTKDVFEAGEKVSLDSLAHIAASDRIDPEKFNVFPEKPGLLDTSKVGEQTINFIVAYLKSGEETVISKTVQIVDTTAPSVKVKRDTVQVTYGSSYNPADNIEYSDFGTPDKSKAKFDISTALDTKKPGVYEVVINVTDEAGNSSNVSYYAEVMKEMIHLELGKTYEADGVSFELLSAGFMDTIIPENPGTVYTYLPSQSKNGNTFYAVRMKLTLVGEGPVNMKSFFSSSRLYVGSSLKPYGFDLKGDANGNITSEVELKQGESGIFYMVFVVPMDTEETADYLSLGFHNFKNTYYILSIR